MANSLINGVPAAESLPAPDPKPATVPTWGYRDGEARLFELEPGAPLPSGWADSPAKVADPEPQGKKRK